MACCAAFYEVNCVANTLARQRISDSGQLGRAMAHYRRGNVTPNAVSSGL
jgi:hypothetical protein